jgi:hypothetical protein
VAAQGGAAVVVERCEQEQLLIGRINDLQHRPATAPEIECPYQVVAGPRRSSRDQARVHVRGRSAGTGARRWLPDDLVVHCEQLAAGAGALLTMVQRQLDGVLRRGRSGAPNVSVVARLGREGERLGTGLGEVGAGLGPSLGVHGRLGKARVRGGPQARERGRVAAAQQQQGYERGQQRCERRRDVLGLSGLHPRSPHPSAPGLSKASYDSLLLATPVEAVSAPPQGHSTRLC